MYASGLPGAGGLGGVRCAGGSGVVRLDLRVKTCPKGCREISCEAADGRKSRSGCSAAASVAGDEPTNAGIEEPTPQNTDGRNGREPTWLNRTCAATAWASRNWGVHSDCPTLFGRSFIYLFCVAQILVEQDEAGRSGIMSFASSCVIATVVSLTSDWLNQQEIWLHQSRSEPPVTLFPRGQECANSKANSGNI